MANKSSVNSPRPGRVPGLILGVALSVGTAQAQEAPLSVIEWLERNAPTPKSPDKAAHR